MDNPCAFSQINAVQHLVRLLVIASHVFESVSGDQPNYEERSRALRRGARYAQVAVKSGGSSRSHVILGPMAARRPPWTIHFFIGQVATTLIV